MKKMNNEINSVNSVNEMVNSKDHHVMFGRDDAGQQAPPGRYQTTARRKWTQTENVLLMELYFRSKPEKIEYRAQLENLWKIKNGEKIAAQYLSNRVRQMKKRRLSDVEIEEIRNKVENEYSNGYTATDKNPHKEISKNRRTNKPLNRNNNTSNIDTQRFRR